MSGVDPSSECVYLCGNSLGLQPKSAEAEVLEVMDSWAKRRVLECATIQIEFAVCRGVYGHFSGPNPWMPIEDSIIGGSAKLVGAKSIEVTVMNSLTVNIHLGLVSWSVCKEECRCLVYCRFHFTSPLHSAIRC